MLSKIKLYLKVCNKGEIRKRIEYKLKDLIGYFYVRNKLTKIETQYYLNLPVIKLEYDYNHEDKYQIFNKVIDYLDIKQELIYTEEFWRKCNISKYDDVKKVWEPNRLQFLLPMAIKYNNKKDIKYKDFIVEILDYWSQKNKFEYSINWNNNLEVAVRAISIIMTLMILNDDCLNKKYSKLIYLHAKYLYNEINYSKACIPNNHLIGEATTLLILSKMLNVKGSKKWYKRAIKILRSHKDIISDEGVSKENSFSYQFFVTKMYILALSFIDSKELFDNINEKIIKSLDFLRYTIIDDKKVINYGDNDNAYYFSIEDKYNLSKDITRYYNYFFESKLDDETKIIDSLLNCSNKIIKRGKVKSNNCFCNKNIFIYKWDNNILFFNAKKIEGHAHNDSLAIVLIINGEEVLLDSGTYSYNLDKEKRRYYRERCSHSTIQLCDATNAIPVGSFRWNNLKDSYIEKVIDDDDKIIVKGIIEDLCSREITISKNEKRIIIKDKTQCNENSKSCWIMAIDRNEESHILDDKININFNDKVNINKNIVKVSSKYFKEDKDAFCYEVSNENELTTNIQYK